MIGWSAIRDSWNAEQIGQIADQVRRTATEFDRVIDSSPEVFPRGWDRGEASEQARTSLRTLARTGEDTVSAALGVVWRACDIAQDELATLLTQVREVEAKAASNQFAIDVHGQPFPAGVWLDDLPQDVIEYRRRVMAELEADTLRLRERATDIDEELAAQLRKAVSVAGIDDSTKAELLPKLADIPEPPGGWMFARFDDADAGAEWWRGLSEEERQYLLAYYPHIVGSMNGVPGEFRDLANRARLPEMRMNIEGKLAEFERQIELGLDVDMGEVQNLRDNLEALDVVDTTLAQPGDRQLLVLAAPSGGRLEAAIANGNVDTADHVVPFTPGLTSNVHDSMAGYDRNMGDLMGTMEDLLERDGRSGETVATVTWIGYQAPQVNWDSLTSTEETVLLENAAQAGAAKLAPFLDGLHTSRADNPPNLTAIGHSYGSVATGLALQEARYVDNAAIFGSPGMGTDNVGNLNLDEGRMLNLDAKGDVVGTLGRFGGNPSFMDELVHGETGAVSAAESPTGRDLLEVRGHSDYLMQDSTSQYNLAAHAVGAPVIEGSAIGAGDIAVESVRPMIDGAGVGLRWFLRGHGIDI